MKTLSLALFLSLLHPAAFTTAQAKTDITQPQIDINLATETELMTLPGIGPSRAAAIIRHRERRPFMKLRDIMRIRGIGRKTFRKLRQHLTLTQPRKRVDTKKSSPRRAAKAERHVLR